MRPKVTVSHIAPDASGRATIDVKVSPDTRHMHAVYTTTSGGMQVVALVFSETHGQNYMVDAVVDALGLDHEGVPLNREAAVAVTRIIANWGRKPSEYRTRLLRANWLHLLHEVGGADARTIVRRELEGQAEEFFDVVMGESDGE